MSLLRMGTSLKASLNVPSEMLIPLFGSGAQDAWLGVRGKCRLGYPRQSPTDLRERVLAWEHRYPN